MRKDRKDECRVSPNHLTVKEIREIKAIKRAGKYKNYSEFIQYLIKKHDNVSNG